MDNKERTKKNFQLWSWIMDKIAALAIMQIDIS